MAYLHIYSLGSKVSLQLIYFLEGILFSGKGVGMNL